MPTKSAAFNGFQPSVDALRDSIGRLEQAAVDEYRTYTHSMFRLEYATPADVPAPDEVWSQVLGLSARDADGSQDFPSLRAFFTHLETRDYLVATARGSSPFPSHAHFSLTIYEQGGGELEVTAASDEAVEHVLAPVRKELRAAREAAEAAREAAEAAAAAEAAKPRPRWWDRIPLPVRWVGSVLTALLIAYVIYVLGWN